MYEVHILYEDILSVVTEPGRLRAAMHETFYFELLIALAPMQMTPYMANHALATLIIVN